MITKDTIEQFRTVKELSNWIDNIFTLNHSREFVTSIRLKSSVEIKILMEEIIPISKFANQYFGNDKKIRIKPIIGNQFYDAVVEGSEEISYLEITRAIDGYDEKLRNEHLDIHGSVWAVGSIEVKNSKASGKREVIFSNEAVCREDEKIKLKQLIRESLEKKIKKKNHYPTKTFLIVTFEDVFWDKLGVEDTKTIDTLIDEEILFLEHSFCGICLMGEHNNYFRVI